MFDGEETIEWYKLDDEEDAGESQVNGPSVPRSVASSLWFRSSGTSAERQSFRSE